MPIFFTRLKIWHPAPLKPLEDFPESWKVYHICTDSHISSSTTFRDVSELEANDKTHARNAYATLIGKAHNGLPIKDQYDEKKCHEVHTFIYNNDSHKIYRIRNGDVRIYFCYVPPSKIVVVLKTTPKHKNELNTREKNELETIACSVLEYSNPAIFELRVI